MNQAEMIAFNAGVAAVLALAKRTADALAPKITSKPTRFNFAIAALDGVAEEGRALLLPSPRPSAMGVVTTTPSVSLIQAGEMMGVSRDTANRTTARTKGYTGEACRDCGNFTLVRNGTCLKCETCGATTGCS